MGRLHPVQGFFGRGPAESPLNYPVVDCLEGCTRWSLLALVPAIGNWWGKGDVHEHLGLGWVVFCYRPPVTNGRNSSTSLRVGVPGDYLDTIVIDLKLLQELLSALPSGSPYGSFQGLLGLSDSGLAGSGCPLIARDPAELASLGTNVLAPPPPRPDADHNPPNVAVQGLDQGMLDPVDLLLEGLRSGAIIQNRPTSCLETPYHLQLVFNTEVFAIYQALRIFEARRSSGEMYTIFSDCQPAIRRDLSDALGPGQQWARAIIEVASRLIESGNEVLILWVPAHAGVTGYEVADGMAKEAAAGQAHDVPDQVRWQASLPHLARRATERRLGATALWIRSCQARTSLFSPREPGLQEEGDAEGSQVHRSGLLPAAVRPRSDRLLFARPDDRPSATGLGRVLVVRMRQETDAPSPLHGVQGVDP